MKQGLAPTGRVDMATASKAMADKKAKDAKPNTFRGGPDERGHFGIFGGRFVAETLMPLILDLERAYDEAKADPKFHAQLENLNTHYAGRPSPLYFAERMTDHLREVSAAAGGKAAPRSTSSATSSTTPAATRSTTALARSCWRCAWEKHASSPRRVQASTASPSPPCVHASGCRVRSSWAQPTSSVRSPTYSA